MGMVGIGIAIILFHLTASEYVARKSYIHIILAGVFLGAAAFISKIGMITAAISLTMMVFANIAVTVIHKLENLKLTLQWIYIIVSSITLVIAMALIYSFSEEKNQFAADVISSYLTNLYGTSRFTAIPFMNVSIIILLLLHFCVYLAIRSRVKNWERNDALFLSLTLSIGLYLVVIGYYFIQKLAPENVQIYGEYMTGFQKYMIIPTVMVYGFWIAVCIRKFLLGREG